MISCRHFGRSELGVRLLSLRSVGDYVRRHEQLSGDAGGRDDATRCAIDVCRPSVRRPAGGESAGRARGTLHFRDLLSETSPVKRLCDPLLWLIVCNFLLLLFGLPYSQPFFAALFPDLPRPVCQQESLPPSRSPISGWWASQKFVCRRGGRRRRMQSRERWESFVPGGDYRRRADLSPVAVPSVAVPSWVLVSNRPLSAADPVWGVAHPAGDRPGWARCLPA